MSRQFCHCGECYCVPEVPPYWNEMQVLKKLHDNGYEAAFAGGCVRDKFLGVKPKDYDIATTATPEEVSKIFDRVLDDGKEYGVTFVIEGGKRIDVATLRKDVGSNGRQPDSVVYTNSFKEDAARRDFTINSMFWVPEEAQPDGYDEKILDFYNGRRDIALRTVRAVGDPNLRIQEDYLRILRAVRFAVTLDYGIDDDLADAIMAHRDGLNSISRERIRDEFFRIVHVTGGAKLLYDLGLLEVIFGFQVSRKALEGVERVLKHKQNVSNAVLLALLVYDVKETGDLQDKFRLTAKEWDELTGILAYSSEAQRFVSMQVFEAIGFLRLNHSRQIMLTYCAFNDKVEDYERYHSASFMFKEQINSKPVVTGQFLIDMGFVPSDWFKVIIDDCRRMQDAGMFSSSELFQAYIRVQFSDIFNRDRAMRVL